MTQSPSAMPPKKSFSINRSNLVADLLAAVAAFWIAFALRSAVLEPLFGPRGWIKNVYLSRDIVILPLFPVLLAAALVANSFYDPHRLRRFRHALAALVFSTVVAVLCLMAVVYVFSHQNLVSRLQIALTAFFSIVLVSLRWRLSRRIRERRRLDDEESVPIHTIVAPFPLLMPLDLVIMIAAFWLAHWTRELLEIALLPRGLMRESWFERHQALMVLYPLCMLIALSANSFYDLQIVRRLRRAVWVLSFSTLEATVAMMSLVYLFSHETLISRWQIALMAVLMNLLLAARWLAMRRILLRRHAVDEHVPARRTTEAPFPTVPIGGLPFHCCTMTEAVDWLGERIRERKRTYIVTPNMDWLYAFSRHPEKRSDFLAADLVLADGVPIFWLSQFLHPSLPEKVSGSDLFLELSAVAPEKGYRIYLLGGEPGVAEAAKERMEHLFPQIQVCGTDAPPHGFEKDPAVWESTLERIRRAQPDILFVAFGAEGQRRFLVDSLDRIDVPVRMGIGASIDFMAGTQKRAPRLMQQVGLEWFWRLAWHPRRLFRRYVLHDLPFLVELAWGIARHRARNG
ncbi:WecB/TagA/CpsF family glycosyltransferase [Candidatus Sumerlaeota bacterium]|nr:WecB/TagA/CpsF family glycosyltransferase [Candidatus Sumerlaeota bacterium]